MGSFVSDADREMVARTLDSAAREGRVSGDELRARLARAHQARVYGDLEQLLADLPGTQEPEERTVREHTLPQTLHITASLRDARRRGSWTVPRRVVATAGLGTVELDLTEAESGSNEITVDARPNWGDVDVIVPEGYTVSTEASIPGAEPVRDHTTTQPRPDAPPLHVVARPGRGSVVVRHPRPG